VLGRRGKQAGPLGRRAREKKEKASGLDACGLKGCWAGGRKEKERRGRGKRVFPFSFKFSFQIHFSNIQTSIKQNPCIRIMMHKHLLFLN
jgi:hypothetical protein